MGVISMKAAAFILSISMCLTLLSGCSGEIKVDDVTKKAEDITTGVVSGVSNAVDKIDKEAVKETIGDVVSTVGGGIASGIGDIVANIDKEKASKSISDIVTVVIVGTVDGVDNALDQLKESGKIDELTSSEKKELTSQIKEAKDSIENDDSLTTSEKSEKLKSLEDIEECLN